MMIQVISNLLGRATCYKKGTVGKWQIFDTILWYEGVKHTFVRSLNSKQPGHILLVGPPGQAKTQFLKSILEAFGEERAFFTVGGNASKSGVIDVLFDMEPKYLLVDEIQNIKQFCFP